MATDRRGRVHWGGWATGGPPAVRTTLRSATVPDARSLSYVSAIGSWKEAKTSVRSQVEDDVEYEVVARGPDAMEAAGDRMALEDYFNLQHRVAALSADWCARCVLDLHALRRLWHEGTACHSWHGFGPPHPQGRPIRRGVAALPGRENAATGPPRDALLLHLLAKQQHRPHPRPRCVLCGRGSWEQAMGRAWCETESSLLACLQSSVCVPTTGRRSWRRLEAPTGSL